MSKKLLIYPEKCIGCRTCEIFCSLSHTGSCNPARSRVNVIKTTQDVLCIPMMCQQCLDPVCAQVCPSHAIHRNEITGAVETDHGRCLGCGVCVAACPFGGSALDPWSGTVVRCDLCEGAPLCAEVCVQGAIVYVEEERHGLLKKRSAAETLLAALKAVAPKGDEP